MTPKSMEHGREAMISKILRGFTGTSEDAVKSQIWIAVPVYVLVAIVRKRLAL